MRSAGAMDEEIEFEDEPVKEKIIHSKVILLDTIIDKRNAKVIIGNKSREDIKMKFDKDIGEWVCGCIRDSFNFKDCPKGVPARLIGSEGNYHVKCENATVFDSTKGCGGGKYLTRSEIIQINNYRDINTPGAIMLQVDPPLNKRKSKKIEKFSNKRTKTNKP